MTMNPDRNWPYPGARWWRFDFHTHTPGSHDTYWYKLVGKEGELTPEQWLQRYMDAEIDCVAVTDHNSGAWIDRLKDAYASMQETKEQGFRELHLFPGVEISVNAGFHLLAIFDKDKTTADMDTLLGKVDDPGTKGNSGSVTRRSPVDVIRAVLEAGGIPIPAHVDDAKGLLRVKEDNPKSPELDANTIRQVLEQPDILAMEVVDRTSPKPHIYEEKGLAWSEVLGSDCHSFRSDNLKLPGTRYTWVKMADPSLEGLRLALMDGDGFSIRRSDDPEPFDPFALPEHFLKKIKIKDARYMGRDEAACLEFSPWFNALIGGRGTGKSTVLHFLRLVYRREHEIEALGADSEVRRTFDRFNRVPGDREKNGGLTDDCQAGLALMRDDIRYFIRWRYDGNGNGVWEDVNGDWRTAESQVVTTQRFPLRLFGQGQIAALAGGSQAALLAVIDEAADANQEHESLEEAGRRFLTLRTQIRDLEGRLAARDPLMVELEDVRRKLARFEDAHHAEVLKVYHLRVRQEREIRRQLDSAGGFADRIRQLAEEIVPEDLPDGLFDSKPEGDAEALALVGGLAQAVHETAKTLQQAAKGLEDNKKRARQELAGSGWQSANAEAKGRYGQLVEALRAQGVSDPSEYGKLVQDRQRLKAEDSRLKSLEQQKKDLEQAAQAQLEGVRQARRALSDKRRRFLNTTLADNPYVRITGQSYGRDARAIEGALREVLGVTDGRFGDDILVIESDRPEKGVVADLLRGLSDNQEAATREIEQRIGDLKRRIEAACHGRGDFGGRFNNFLRREFERRPEFLDRIKVWFPEDGLTVEYSPKGDGRDFRPINQASAGQRAATMLAFLLAYGSEPLVLDQPEDDLDNHLIYDLVVRQIRANKLKRQIILVTHNPNIVVNGDAEMLHVLDFVGGQCRLVKSGSLQQGEVREEVCRVMEGGREAFERRYRRLGKEPTHVR